MDSFSRSATTTGLFWLVVCLVVLVASPAPVAESWAAATNVADGQCLLGWAPPLTHSGESLQLCFSVDFEPATFCAPAAPAVQTLPVALAPGAHTLHVTTIRANGDAAGAPLALPVFVADAPGADPASPRVLFTSPAFGARLEFTAGPTGTDAGGVVSGSCELGFVVVAGGGVVGGHSGGRGAQVGLRQHGDAHQAGGRCSVISCPPINPACDP